MPENGQIFFQYFTCRILQDQKWTIMPILFNLISNFLQYWVIFHSGLPPFMKYYSVLQKIRSQIEQYRHNTLHYSRVQPSVREGCTVISITWLQGTIQTNTVPMWDCHLFYCCLEIHCTLLYCIVLYCTVIYCIVLYYTVLYCITLNCSVSLFQW